MLLKKPFYMDLKPDHESRSLSERLCKTLKFSASSILAFLGILLLDLIIWFAFGLLLMNYEDFYQPSDGPYYSWESMDRNDRIIYISIMVWQYLNYIALIYLIFRLWKRFQRFK